MGRENPTPAETARFDQAKAHAREIGRTDPDTWVLIVESLPAGEHLRCCWCDCPDPDLDAQSPHADPEYACAGCEEPAELRLLAGHGSASESAYPLCTRHLDDVLQFLGRATAAGGGPR